MIRGISSLHHSNENRIPHEQRLRKRRYSRRTSGILKGRRLRQVAKIERYIRNEELQESDVDILFGTEIVRERRSSPCTVSNCEGAIGRDRRVYMVVYPERRLVVRDYQVKYQNKYIDMMTK